MDLKTFLILLRKDVKSSTGKHFSRKNLSIISGLSDSNLQSWEEGSVPVKEREQLLSFFEIDSIEDISDESLKKAVAKVLKLTNSPSSNRSDDKQSGDKPYRKQNFVKTFFKLVSDYMNANDVISDEDIKAIEAASSAVLKSKDEQNDNTKKEK